MTQNNLGELFTKCKRKAGLLAYCLEKKAMSAGLIKSQLDYSKFIVIGRSRTGSNFLRGLLNSHSEIIAFGEIFRDYNRIGWDLWPESGCRASLDLFQNEPIRFIEEKVFRKYPVKISAVGFKIFYYHAQNNSWKCIWNYLKGYRDLKIIHITRENVLKTYLSWKRANQTNQWIKKSQKNEAPIRFDYDEFLHVLTKTGKWEQECDRFFKDHPKKINVTYESLARNYEEESAKIQQFLGVDIESLQPKTTKQATLPISEAIDNYYELKEKFKNSPWERFFEE